MIYCAGDVMFSVRFWQEKLPAQRDISNQPLAEHRLTVEKARELLQNIQKKGSLGFVQECVKELGTYRIRVVPDTFMHNLSCLFQQVQKLDCKVEEKRKQESDQPSSDIDVEMVDARAKRSRSPSNDKKPCAKQRQVSSTVDVDAVLSDIQRDLDVELSEAGLKGCLNYAECCQIVEPDYAILVGNTLFPVHRSLLSYFPYWAALFQSPMRETQEKYMVIKQIEPEDFVRVLEWIYSGSLEFIENPEGIKEAINANSKMLRRVNQIADRFGLESLMATCSKMEQALGNQPPALHNSSPLECTRPAALELFHDVHFKIGQESFSANRVLLASGSRYFRDLLVRAKGKGTKENPILVDVPNQFFPVWLKAIHSRKTVGFASDMEQWLTDENVFSFMKIFHFDRDFQSKKTCCEYIVDKNLLSELPEQDAFYFDYLNIPIRNSNVEEILTNHRLKIRECRIIGDNKYDIREGAENKLNNWVKNHGKDIRRLDLVDGYVWVDDDFIAYVAENCPNLQSLHIHNCINITDGALIKLAELCPQLKELVLTVDKKRQDYNLISDAGICRLAEGCRRLQKLWLRDCESLGDQAFYNIAKYCPDLQEIALPPDITDRGIAHLVMHCRKLQHVDMEQCEEATDVAIALIASHCPHLKVLNIARVSLRGDDVIRFLAQNCPELEFLNLSELKITEDTQRYVVETCPNLKIHIRTDGERVGLSKG